MNILMVCTKYSLEKDSPWLTDELANAYLEQGHSVNIIFLDWNNLHGNHPQMKSISSSHNVLILPALIFNSFPSVIRQSLKWFFSSSRFKKEINTFFEGKQIDYIIGITPALIIRNIVKTARRRFKCKGCLLLWDFYPYHSKEMGLIKKGPIFKIFKSLEEQSFRQYTKLGLTTDQGITFLKKHYTIHSDQETLVIPLWGTTYPNRLSEEEKKTVRKQYGLPEGRKIAVFGGQFIRGRAFDDIIALAKRSKQNHLNMIFIFIGSGNQKEEVKHIIEKENLDNVLLMGALPRKEYLNLLQVADMGLVSLTDKVNIPSFPSKTIDYLRVGLPILASVNAEIDYSQFIENQKVGLCSAAGNMDEYYKNLFELYALSEGETKAIKLRAIHCFEHLLEVSLIANKIISMKHSE